MNVISKYQLLETKHKNSDKNDKKEKYDKSTAGDDKLRSLTRLSVFRYIVF